MIRRSKKARKRHRAITQLDAIARNEVFERDGHKCVRCGKNGRIEWAHVISRRHLITRWLPENALTLCFYDHAWWNSYPSLSGPWFVNNFPERHEYITKVYNEGGKVKPELLLAEAQGDQ
jgi:hypothetical protein